MDESALVKLAIARDLHDGLAQEVTALGYRIDEIIGYRDTTAQTRDDLRELRQRISMVSGLIRDEIFSLRGIDPRSLTEVVESLGEEIFVDSRIDFRVNLGENIPPSARPGLMKIIQEALFNIRKHSSATHIEVFQKLNTITVRDDGGGQYNPTTDRWGIAGMQERALAFGGSVEFVRDHLGTAIIVSWSPQP